jgi:sugar phosphate isomerase/epimerase
MVLTLMASCLGSLLRPSGQEKPALALTDLPTFTREQLGLGGINLTTDLLVGARRANLEKIRERADRAGCSCLLLYETEAQELGMESEDEANIRIGRLQRVVEAAQILGCSAVGAKVRCDLGDEAVEQCVDRLKIVVETAEKFDLNFLIAPSEGLTAEPERLTDLIKRVGGFRIGTLPDFQVAMESKDPITYLRRLTPYASAVVATTIEFGEASSTPPPPPLPQPVAKAKTSKKEDPKKPTAKPKAEELLEDDDEGLEDLLEAIEAGVGAEAGEEEGGEEAPPPEPEYVHKTFDLPGLMNAVRSVGYDSNLSVNYRGPGDPTVGVTRSRKILQRILASPLNE